MANNIRNIRDNVLRFGAAELPYGLIDPRHLVVAENWSVSYAHRPDGWHLNVRQLDADGVVRDRHSLDGAVFDSHEQARRAAYEAGVLHYVADPDSLDEPVRELAVIADLARQARSEHLQAMAEVDSARQRHERYARLREGLSGPDKDVMADLARRADSDRLQARAAAESALERHRLYLRVASDLAKQLTDV